MLASASADTVIPVPIDMATTEATPTSNCPSKLAAPTISTAPLQGRIPMAPTVITAVRQSNACCGSIWCAPPQQ
ncbi:hypothetical protein HORIV_56320 [Vreelandella olivaria]|uniref:Uncharacterized protein n=1 Tax=Vreelandella olivaria TaxID=390919 RepID=A0ABN5X296_9GAMM|nr:hypothetical protein HORIV_56320 [Halomonas olivaria]